MKCTQPAAGPFPSQPIRKFHALHICLLAFMAFFFNASLSLAQSNLARLIPPDARVIAGLHQMPEDQRSDALWLATRNNLDDLNRMLALTNSDPDRRVEYVIVADWPSNTDDLGSHLLIAQGRFSLPNILSTIAHPQKMTYNGITILAVKSPAGSQHTARWLAIPHNDVAIFGTPSGVQVALDRFRSRAAADPRILARLMNAHDNDAAWSSIMLPQGTLRQSVNFPATTDNLLPCLSRMREVDLGIQIGKTVSIDLHTEPRDDSAGGAMECMSAAIFKNYTPAMRVSLGGQRQPSMRLALTRAEYDRWLQSFRHSSASQTLQALISGPEQAAERADDRQPVP